MPDEANQPYTGAWLGLPPDEDSPVSLPVKYRCVILMLLYWAILSAVPLGTSRQAQIGDSLPAWMAVMDLTPFLIVPAFLSLAVRTGAQWRSLMITIYAGLLLNLLMYLLLPANAMWGDLPAAGFHDALVWKGGELREWVVTLPRFSLFWGLAIYVFLSGAEASPILRLLALAWWFLLFLIPVNTGMTGYADILGPLVIMAGILSCMHLAARRKSRRNAPHH